jgi:hypothetical protein
VLTVVTVSVAIEVAFGFRPEKPDIGIWLDSVADGSPVSQGFHVMNRAVLMTGFARLCSLGIWPFVIGTLGLCTWLAITAAPVAATAAATAATAGTIFFSRRGSRRAGGQALLTFVDHFHVDDFLEHGFDFERLVVRMAGPDRLILAFAVVGVSGLGRRGRAVPGGTGISIA